MNIKTLIQLKQLKALGNEKVKEEGADACYVNVTKQDEVIG